MQIGVEISRALENKRIFLVSDDEIARAALQFMLHDEYEAHDLADLAAAYAKAAEGRPDLLLLGLEIVKRAARACSGRLRRGCPAQKSCLSPKRGRTRSRKGYLKAGAHSVLTKPLTVEGVRRKVGIVLGRGTNQMVQLSILPGKAG